MTTNQTDKNTAIGLGEADSKRDEVQLIDYLDLIWSGKWIILGTALLCLLGGFLYARLATPIYATDVLIQVEETTAKVAGLDELTELFSGEAPAVTEIEVLRSRNVVGKTVDMLRLDYVVQPLYFPVIGAASARRAPPAVLAEPWLGYDSYAWGGERITVKRLSMAPEMEGRELRLLATGIATYELYDPEIDMLLGTGTVGGRFTPVPGTPGGSIDLFVQELRARTGTQFIIGKKPWAKAVTELQRRLRISEKGKGTGIIRLSLEGRNRVLVQQTLSTLSNAYVQQNVERRSAQAEQSLEFLDQQLPELRSRVEAAEGALNHYRERKQTIDLTLETQALLDKMVNLERQISDLELKRASMRRNFGESHPAILTINEQRGRLEDERAGMQKQINTLPETQQEVLRLSRDVQVNTQLYTFLLNKAQELRVIKAGTVGNVRVLDEPILPYEPIKPDRTFILLASLLGGALLGLMIVMLRRALNPGVVDPQNVEERVGLPVFAVVPHSAIQQRDARDSRRRKTSASILARDFPQELAVENLRGVRSSVHFTIAQANNPVVVISGPSPAIGKSFVTVNLGYLLADAGKRVLIIDADMRKGHLHGYFGCERKPGLSNLLIGEKSFGECIQHGESPRLDFMPMGSTPPKPAELLVSEAFKTLLDAVSSEYDVVLVDTPPIMAVSDATTIAQHAAALFMVVRAGQNSLDEIEQAIKRVRQNRGEVAGLLLNDISRKVVGSPFGRYKYYSYEYKDQ